MHRISFTRISLRRRAHKLVEMGVPSKMHPRIKTRAHLSAAQRKAGPGECHLGSADPLGRPTLVGLIRAQFSQAVSQGSPTSIPGVHSTTSRV